MLVLAAMLSVDTAHVSRLINNMAIQFAGAFADLVSMPPVASLQNKYVLGANIIGALDGTDFRIAHPYGFGVRASNFYRGDKKHHFQLALILSDATLHVVWVALGIPGHNNDQRAFKQSNLMSWLARQHGAIAVLTDGGFTGPSFIRPVVAPHTFAAQLWNEVVRQERSPAEHCNAYLKHWKVLTDVFHGTHELHTLLTFCVIIIYNARHTWKQTQQ